MCVRATKGTYRRDIKMIVNHDYIKQCIIFEKKILADYTSKYCLLSIQLTSACIYTPQHTYFGCFVCILLVPYFLLNPIRSGGGGGF